MITRQLVRLTRGTGDGSNDRPVAQHYDTASQEADKVRAAEVRRLVKAAQAEALRRHRTDVAELSTAGRKAHVLDCEGCHYAMVMALPASQRRAHRCWLCGLSSGSRTRRRAGN
jgi:hypothetical protein